MNTKLHAVSDADGRPLSFFHFSGFDPTRPKTLSKHQNRLEVEPGSDLAELLADFAKAMLRNGHAQTSPIPYAFGAFASGRTVTRWSSTACATALTSSGVV